MVYYPNTLCMMPLPIGALAASERAVAAESIAGRKPLATLHAGTRREWRPARARNGAAGPLAGVVGPIGADRTCSVRSGMYSPVAVAVTVKPGRRQAQRGQSGCLPTGQWA